MRNCEYCGTFLPERARFCSACGQALRTQSNTSPFLSDYEEIPTQPLLASNDDDIQWGLPVNDANVLPPHDHVWTTGLSLQPKAEHRPPLTWMEILNVVKPLQVGGTQESTSVHLKVGDMFGQVSEAHGEAKYIPYHEQLKKAQKRPSLKGAISFVVVIVALIITVLPFLRTIPLALSSPSAKEGSYTAQTNYGSSWLKLNQSSGTVAPNETDQISFTASASSSDRGLYSAIIRITSNGGNQQITATMTVVPSPTSTPTPTLLSIPAPTPTPTPTSTPTPTPTPTSTPRPIPARLCYVQGTNLGEVQQGQNESGTITVGNCGGQPLTWQGQVEGLSQLKLNKGCLVIAYPGNGFVLQPTITT